MAEEDPINIDPPPEDASVHTPNPKDDVVVSFSSEEIKEQQGANEREEEFGSDRNSGRRASLDIRLPDPSEIVEVVVEEEQPISEKQKFHLDREEKLQQKERN